MTSEDHTLRLAQGLCTRLCHDLAGSLGAIGSGAELLTEEGGADPEVVALMADSAAAATTRLRFLRAVLGAPSGRGLLPHEAGTLLEAHIATRGATLSPALTWHVQGRGSDVEVRQRVQLLLNLCLVVLDAAPRCEQLMVEDAGGATATIAATGVDTPQTTPLDGLSTGLTGAEHHHDARAVQATYAGALARSLGITVRVDIEPSTLSLHLGTTDQ
ncbi:hypothetical protein F1188_08315 [Roseospira marina]|uniref:Histidine phosphotransferase ChpT C-terminal domain-containing protein n=1 Tax=Roseospira marina TaxID=140057 RepID=A0A5M6ICM7_9PROT|nr:histidine phosphotransferase family protein [Roseospira marina]KAA5606011.1 hypothetical protein F1188_08315 [Roseospira marina]MBB4313135.1 histidine phosphotransferase ChpT [Roseospira marina]MBB5086124.1 histidine phosphotransferase ChpT [Roseospira marina]